MRFFRKYEYPYHYFGIVSETETGDWKVTLKVDGDRYEEFLVYDEGTGVEYLQDHGFQEDLGR